MSSFLQNAIVDWGWRAMHLSVVVGKEVVKQYYGEAQNTSYYMGCSTGILDALLKLTVIETILVHRRATGVCLLCFW